MNVQDADSDCIYNVSFSFAHLKILNSSAKVTVKLEFKN